jgi:hypothetical protein
VKEGQVTDLKIKRKRKPKKLTVRLAKPEDTPEIDRLREYSYSQTAKWAQLQVPLSYVMRANDSEEDEVLVGFDPSGQMVTTVRLSIAETIKQAHQQLGAVISIGEGQLPILDVGRACALPGGGFYKTLRLAYTQFMIPLRVNGHAIAAQMGVNSAANPVPDEVVRWGYDVIQVTEGEFILTGPHVCNQLWRSKFLYCIETMRAEQEAGKFPACFWQGPPPFEKYLPDYVAKRR